MENKENKELLDENVFDNDYFTLTDEEGNEIEFEMIGRCEKDGKQYFAMIPVEEEAPEGDIYEYVILKLDTVDGEEMLVTVDDDEELDNIADYFDDLFSQEIDYDN